jgi:hypothetical protein
MLPGLYLAMRTVGLTPRDVDDMKVWQVAAVLSYARAPRRPEEPVAGPRTPRRPTGGWRPVDDRSLIRARLQAHREGKPEPLHLFGVTDPRLLEPSET